MKLAFVFVLCTSSCFCWWDTGHMLVAEVARLVLEKYDSNALDLAERVTNILKNQSHGWVNNFVESACWPDDLKKKAMHSMDNWHFTDLPIYLNSTKISFPNCTDCSSHIIHDMLNNVLTWTKDEIEDLDYQYEKSTALRFLTHIIGDVHQPLHSAALFNEIFPHGDQGGNLFKIHFGKNPKINELHAFFDSGAGRLEEFPRPLNWTSTKYLREYAYGLIREFGDYFNKTTPNLHMQEKWINESAVISKDFIYANLVPGGNITEVFEEESYQIIRKRIYEGGQRLANVVVGMSDKYEDARRKYNLTNDIYNNTSEQNTTIIINATYVAELDALLKKKFLKK